MLSTGWTAAVRDEPFDRHQPVRWMNGPNGLQRKSINGLI
jgi:hypothetical protein